MVLVIGSVTLRAGTIDEALAASLDHVSRSRGEPGCLSHAVHRDAENALRLVFIEEWTDMAALQQHFQVPASRAFVKTLSALAAEPPQITIHDARRIGP
jgi:quinol monooxygenase YgiN